MIHHHIHRLAFASGLFCLHVGLYFECFSVVSVTAYACCNFFFLSFFCFFHFAVFSFFINSLIVLIVEG
ncbi:hypothetical protein CICLE_v10030336mg [Citrus x clementina]|uniref:Uncharacterized protein n=1 Tax=Citrus clementina TaxID=85681 RepID=V4UGG4_CITCL|nr:hypothetical protein CICLE_v10030336mg [Citrus x clementina]